MKTKKPSLSLKKLARDCNLIIQVYQPVTKKFAFSKPGEYEQIDQLSQWVKTDSLWFPSSDQRANICRKVEHWLTLPDGRILTYREDVEGLFPFQNEKLLFHQLSEKGWITWNKANQVFYLT